MLALAKKAANAEQISSFYGALQRVIVQALSEGRYQPASELANAVCHVCQRSQGKEFRKKSLGQRQWVREYCRRQEQRREAEAKLKANPEDAESASFTWATLLPRPRLEKVPAAPCQRKRCEV